MKQVRGTCLLAGFLTLTVLLIPVQWAALRVSKRLAARIPRFYHGLVCRLIGTRVHVSGVPISGEQPVLIAANHTSWLDIPILSSVVPCSFVAKSEVGGWPFFGTLARLQRTVFVERKRRHQTAEHRDRIHERLAAGDTLVLFPEGTSGDGNRVLSFNSALMSVAQRDVRQGLGSTKVKVQPVSVAYTDLHGLPMGRYYRPRFAWYGDMDLVPHLWEMFCIGPIDVQLRYHEPVTIDQFQSRKELTHHCQSLVADGVATMLAGRAPWRDGREEASGDTEADQAVAAALRS